MVHLQSKSFCNYYSSDPSEYYLKCIHHDFDIVEHSDDEYKLIESDLDKIYNFDRDSFMLYFSNTTKYIDFISHINVKDTYKGSIFLRIRDINEFYQLKKYSNLYRPVLIIDILDVEKLNILDYEMIVQFDTVSQMSTDKLEYLRKQYNIIGVLFGQMSYLDKCHGKLYEIMSEMYNVDSSQKYTLEKLNKITTDIYTVDEYKTILQKFSKILNQLDIKNKIDGFYKIFDYIARNVPYDYDAVIRTNINNQNLIGPVIQGKSVCEGYSKFLQQLISLNGIESIIVQGGGAKEDGGHVWNQVLIDGKWYNADVTAASYNFNNNKSIFETCLVKDTNIRFISNSSLSHICDDDFIYDLDKSRI